jgi:hypothetical protein
VTVEIHREDKRPNQNQEQTRQKPRYTISLCGGKKRASLHPQGRHVATHERRDGTLSHNEEEQCRYIPAPRSQRDVNASWNDSRKTCSMVTKQNADIKRDTNSFWGQFDIKRKFGESFKNNSTLL